MVVELRTVSGRSVLLEHPVTHSRLLAAAVRDLRLEQGTVHLLFRGTELLPHADVDDEAGAVAALEAAGVGDGCHVVAVGVRSALLTPSPAPTVASRTPRAPQTPHGTLASADAVSTPHGGPLPFPHAPDGLSELTWGLEERAGDEYALFHFLESHVTMQAIRDVVQKDPVMLEAVLLQARASHPPFLTAVARNMELFLDVVNGRQRRFLQDLFAGPDVTEREREALAQVGADMMAALGSLFGGDVQVDIRLGADGNEGVDGAGSLNDAATPHRVEEGPPDASALQAELDRAVAEDNHLTAAMCCQQLAELERTREQPSSALAVSQLYNDAVDHALMMPSMALTDSSGAAMAAVSHVAPPIVVAAQLWFLEQGDARRSLEVCIAHFAFWDMLERRHHGTLLEKSPGETVDDLLALSRRTGDGPPTVVLYSLLQGVRQFVTYVIAGGAITGRTTPFVADAFRADLRFMERSTRQGELGVNATRVWTERLSTMYATLIEPIEDLLPPRPSDLYARAGRVCFVPTMTKLALPFHAMMDARGIPAIAKWEVCQCPNHEVLLDTVLKAEHRCAGPAAAPALEHSHVVADTRPAWLTRTISRSLAMEHITAQRLEKSLVLHLCEGARPHFAVADAVVCESFSRQLLASLAAAHTAAFARCLDTPGEAPYELMRHFYRALCRTGSIACAAREAMLRCNQAAPDLLWQWASFGVLNVVVEVPALTARAAHAARHAERASQRRKALAASSEGQYAQQHSLGELYDEMIHHLLAERPEADGDILTSLHHFLERNKPRLEALCSTDGDAATTIAAAAAAPQPVAAEVDASATAIEVPEHGDSAAAAEGCLEQGRHPR